MKLGAGKKQGQLEAPMQSRSEATPGLLYFPRKYWLQLGKSEQTAVCLSSNLEDPSASYFTVEATTHRRQSKGSDRQ